jgi:hypothetical protein
MSIETIRWFLPKRPVVSFRCHWHAECNLRKATMFSVTSLIALLMLAAIAVVGMVLGFMLAVTVPHRTLNQGMKV